jgi:small subunit ribosomal protein S6
MQKIDSALRIDPWEAGCLNGLMSKRRNFAMPQYETMYILRPDLSDEQTDQAIGRYQNILLEQGAEPVDTQHRGKRRLAYEIQNHREGVYVQMNYTSSGKAVMAMEKAMRLSEDVIRYLTIKVEIPAEAPEAVEA